MLPLLPPDVQAQVLREHAAIRRCGFLPRLVRIHGEREVEILRAHCHPELVAVIVADHAQIDAIGHTGCGGCG